MKQLVAKVKSFTKGTSFPHGSAAEGFLEQLLQVAELSALSPTLASPGGCVLAWFPKFDLEGTHCLIQIFNMRASDKEFGKSEAGAIVMVLWIILCTRWKTHKPSYGFGIGYF